MKAYRDVLVRFHEIGLKGKNRPMFIRQLVDNIRRATIGMGVEKVWSGRMIVRLRLEEDADWEMVRERVSRVFGAVKFAPAQRVALDYDAISEAVAELADERTFETFRITAHRADKRFPITTHDLNVRLGDLVRERSGARVDLKHADLDLHVETMADEAFVYADGFSGSGGLPVGTAGRVVVLMSGGIDSPVATWRMMKRGCRATLVHFHSFPLVEGRSREKARELAEILNAYQYDTRLLLVPFAEIQKRIILTVPGALRVVAYRRFMVRIAEAIAYKEGARALVTGESLGQVGSQTLPNMATVNEVAHMPILRPLVGFDKQEIIEQAVAINTFETSILPDEDCCTLFVPKSPSTSVRSDEIVPYEDEMDMAEMVAEAVKAAEVFEYHMPVA
ncbi:MAG: tRNA 4-thiouridine(8) synthase ThiI [Chloroflexi bacterium]|nr:tRNA 4-thiouridine(8) synthase ThiI [Chloroflexota bacterium]